MSKSAYFTKLRHQLEAASEVLTAAFEQETLSQKPFAPHTPDWVCTWQDGSVNALAVNKLDKCLDLCLSEAKKSTIKAIRARCVKLGYAVSKYGKSGMPLEREWDIQWNPERATQLRKRYAFHVEEDGSLCVAP